MWATSLAVVVFATVSATADRGPAALGLALAASAVVGVWLARTQRLTALEVAVVAVPISFYPPVATQFNASLADPVVLVAVLAAALVGRRRPAGVDVVVCWALAVQLVVWASLVWPLLTMRGATLSAGLAGAAKLAIMSAYVLLGFVGARQAGRTGDGGADAGGTHLRFLDLWTRTASTVAVIGIAGSLAYTAGIDTGLSFDFRATGTFEDPNAFGVYLLLSLGIAMAAAYRRTGRALTWHLVPMLVALVMTGSRAAILALVIATVATAVTGGLGGAGARFRAAAVFAVVAAGAAFLVLPRSLTAPSVERATGVLQPGTVDTNRLELWSSAVDLWQHQPFLGVGIGQFRAASGTLLAAPTAFVPHHTYLGLLAEVGIIGALVILALPLLAGLRLVAARARGQGVATFLLFSMVAFAVEAVTLSLESFRPFWLLVGLALALSLPPPDGSSPGTRHPTTRAGLLAWT
ncbi:O-antigen ligase family protein [Georgenia faecalis]|uniref:O-antigen ligase family protein n=1 Tax=Georgenia faecalis TaxID=2483799 RepID=UPI000FDA48AF|nr:O-antigen ligase family protein [Georgenia faecalis]